jgi:hypothetical protein
MLSLNFGLAFSADLRISRANLTENLSPEKPSELWEVYTLCQILGHQAQIQQWHAIADIWFLGRMLHLNGCTSPWVYVDIQPMAIVQIEESHRERRQMEQFTFHICSSWPLSTQFTSDSILGNKVWTIKQSGPFTDERSVSQSPGKDVQTV